MWIFQNPSKNSRTTGSVIGNPVLQNLRRRLALSGSYVSPGAQLVGATPRDVIAGAQIAEDFHQRSRRESDPHIHPFCLAVADADHKRSIRRRRDAATRHEERRPRTSDRPSDLTERTR